MKGGVYLAKKELCHFGERIEHRIVDIRQTDKWLIDEVRTDTGKFFDRSYLHKIKTGELSTPGIVASICKILEIPAPTE
jgi:hypothetical protein